MIELSQIFFYIFIFLILFSFPITPYLSEKYLKEYNFDIYNIYCINIILNLNIYLILSIFIIDIVSLFFINVFLAFTFIAVKFKENLIFLKSSNWKLLLFFFLINISIFLSLAEDPKLTWDGLVQWLPKASTFFQGLGFSNVGAKPYPHLGGFIWGYFWKNSFLENEYFGRFFFVFFYIVSIFSLINFLKLKEKIKLPIIIILLTLVIALTFDKFLFGGYQDTVLFSLLLISSKLLYLIVIQNRRNFFIFLFYFLTIFICSWIKQEGFIYFIILSLIIILFEKNFKNKIYFLIVTSSLIFIYLFVKNYLIGEIQFDQKLNIEIFNSLNFILIKNFLFDISVNLISAIIKYPLWLFILFFIFISVFSKKKIFQLKYLYTFFIFNFLFIFFIIFYSCLNLGLDMCGLIMRVSMDRILYQTSGFYLVWIIYIFYKCKFFSEIKRGFS